MLFDVFFVRLIVCIFDTVFQREMFDLEKSVLEDTSLGKERKWKQEL